ncbi:MAG: hypothetical protein JKY93_09060 [Gammaproteobacteria bacterium]|nr:hypothetical protein [Gammaproteobacteria bacterium]
MNTSESNQLIEAFVRGPLSCNCPDKVFEKIEQIDSPVEFADLATNNLIKIGGILVLLTLHVDDWQSLQAELQGIFERGIQLRDEMGYNRFRLVIATPDTKNATPALTQQFESFSAMDEKIHLHVVTPEELPQARSN